jgi:CHAT domain
MASAVLRLCITGSPGAYTVLAEVDNNRDSDTLGPLPDKLKENLERLQEAMLLTSESLSKRTPVRAGPVAAQPPAAAAMRGFNWGDGFADTKGIQEIGSRLFDCVFQPAVYKLYKDSLQDALVRKDQVHIKLCVEPPELAYVPWESMFDKRGLFYLCCSQRTPFSRATEHELDLPMYEKPPLRILCMVSAPKDFIGTSYELRTDVEQANLDKAFEQLKQKNQLKLCWTASGTQRELTTRIVKGDEGERWDVFLFIGHGREGQVVLEEDGGTGYQPIPAEVLRGILDADNGPKLVLLNSCRGAKKPEDRLASTAETLVKGSGISAVVAMQFDISDFMATKFSPAFFSNLMLKVPIQRAMTLTRLDLQGAGFSEWISPVLYMQNKDGWLWQDAGASAARGA